MIERWRVRLLGTTRTWADIGATIGGSLVILFIAWLAGMIAVQLLQQLGAVPTNWPAAWLALPAALLLSQPFYWLVKWQGWGRYVEPADPDGGAVMIAFMTLAFIVFGFVTFGWVVSIESVLKENGISLAPAGFPQWTGALGVLLAGVIALAVIGQAEKMLRRALDLLPTRHRQEIFLCMWWGLGLFLTWVWWTNWRGFGGYEADGQPRVGVFLTAALCFALGVVAWRLATLRRISGGRSWLTTLLGIGLAYCMFMFFTMSLLILRYGFRSPPIVDGRLLEWAAWGLGPLVGLAVLSRWLGVSASDGSGGSVGVVSDGTRNGFALLAWSQEVGTGESKGQSGSRALGYVMLGTLLGGAAIGFFMGGWQSAAIGAFIGGWFAALAPREAAVPDLRFPMQGSAGTPRAPRALTDQERQQLSEPVTRREDCEAFLDASGEELLFCLARGDKSLGALPVVAAVRLKEMGHFEVGSHAEWLRSRALASDLRDWNIVFNETPAEGVIVIAESVHDKVWLTNLRARLALMFDGAAREKLLTAFAEEREKMRAVASGSGPLSGGDVPVKPF